jgi:hypothetical protein
MHQGLPGSVSNRERGLYSHADMHNGILPLPPPSPSSPLPIQMSTPSFLAMGLGGDGDHPGLKLDASLDTGSSHACSVFGNLPLCGRGLERFQVARVEVVQLGPPHNG